MSGIVLLVDDDPSYRRTIRYYLGRDTSYHFVEASSPAEGIKTLEVNPQIRVVLLDLKFDGPSKADDLLAYTSKRPFYYRVVVLTAYDDQLSAEKAANYSIFTYLPKVGQTSVPREALRFTVDQAFKDLERVELSKKIGFIQQVQKTINEQHRLNDTLDAICKAVIETLDGYTCHIRVLDPNSDTYRIAGFAGPAKSLRGLFDQPRTRGEFFSGRVVETGQPDAYSDLQTLQEFIDFAAESVAGRVPAEADDLYWRTISSAYIVPIKTGVFGDSVDAILNVSCQQRDVFASEEKQVLVEEFATLAEIALTKHWLSVKRQKIHRDYSRIGEMLDAISDCVAKPDALGDIYRHVAQTASKLVHSEVITIFRSNSWTKRIEAVYEEGGVERHDATVESYGPGQSLTGTVFQTGQPLHLPDPQDPESPKPVKHLHFERENPQGFLTHAPSRALDHYLAVPIRIGNDIIGVLRVVNRKARDYTPTAPRLLERGFGTDCRYLLDIIGHLLAMAIRLAELLRDSRDRLELAQIIGAASRLIGRAHSVEELLDITAYQIADTMKAQVAMLFLTDTEKNRVVLKRTSGMKMIDDASYELGEGLTGLIASQQEGKLIARAPASDGKYDVEIAADLPERDGRPGLIESLMVVPVKVRGTTVGVMKVVNRRGDLPPYTEDDLSLFQTFADYFAVSFENARLFDQTNEQMNVHLRNTALSTLISAVASEIRNTSDLIPGHVAGLRGQLGSANEGITRRLNLIERLAVQATDFANELAGFGLSTRGERERLNITDVVLAIVTEMQDSDKYPKTIRLEWELSKEPLFCLIYPNPFAQIVRNLVVNAYQALEESRDGCIRISTYGHPTEAVLLIDDNGPGVPADYEAKIFEPDFTTKPNGNGIGLWLVRTQLEQIGGRIELQSKEGKGARLAVIVPRDEPLANV